MPKEYGMRLCWLCFLAVFLGSTSYALAGEQPGVFHRASCTVVRYYVAKYSASAAESWARSEGASEAEIEAARRCLKGIPIQTAQTGQQ
jgi:hypothetical protein